MPISNAPTYNARDWTWVEIPGCSAPMGLEIKKQLTESGLIQEQDFVWLYQSAEYDGFTTARERYTTFGFRDPAMASFFRLKWA